MLINRSTFSCALACGGNETCETLRSDSLAIEGGISKQRNREPNFRELVSTSLHNPRVANLPELVKPVIGDNLTVVYYHRTRRGDWRGRAVKEKDMSREIQSSVTVRRSHSNRFLRESITSTALGLEVGGVRMSVDTDVMSVEQRSPTVCVFILKKGVPLE